LQLIPEAEVGQEIEFPKPTDILGRIAAQTAKQVIFQKVREAERDNVFAEYSGRVGEVINGIIKRQEMGDFVVDLGRAEALLPRKEQSRAETYQTGDRVRVAIVKVLKSAKGPQVVVSRTDPALLIKLFEMEVPEIYDGTVQIKGCVREAGERAKVAVISREKDVDPVGACVGMKGTRVQSIIRELRGEKIDIVEWNDDPATFVLNALSPAKVSRVSILDEEQRIMEVVVEDKQLSLAIGKKGQNVRLAAKIVGWRIDIKSEEEKRQEVEAEMARMERIVEELRSLEGVGEKVQQKLIDSGLAGLAHILEMTDEELCQIEGIGAKTAEKIRESATAAKVDWDRRDAEEAARLEAERVEAERLALEQAEEDRRLAEEQAAAELAEAESGTDDGADSPAEAEAASDEALAVASAEPSGRGADASDHGGKPDGER
jgi:N utilization substance protein A